MLKILKGTESKTQFGKGKIGVGASRAGQNGSGFDKSGIADDEFDGGEVGDDEVGKKVQKSF